MNRTPMNYFRIVWQKTNKEIILFTSRPALFGFVAVLIVVAILVAIYIIMN